MKKMFKRKNGLGAMVAVIAAIVIGGLILGGFGMFAVKQGWFESEGALSIQQQQKVQAQDTCSQNPAYTYSAVDTFSTTTILGTDRIKSDGNKPVTSLAAPPAGKTLEYWKDNSTVFCEVVTEEGGAKCGSQTMQTQCYQNSTSTSLKLYDRDNKQFVTTPAAAGAANNVSIGANGAVNLQITYQGTAKYANMPFGGCLAIEVPTTITEVIVNGEGLTSSNLCPYTWTYAVSATTNTYKLFAVPSGFDKDASGDLKEIDVQLKAGSTDPTTATAYYEFMPADYYVTNDGNIVLGIEKDKNGDTTKVKGSAGKISFYIK